MLRDHSKPLPQRIADKIEVGAYGYNPNQVNFDVVTEELIRTAIVDAALGGSDE